MKKMRFCSSCGRYTFSESHCGAQTVSAHPAKFNLRDRYGKYRRQSKYGVSDE